MHPVDYADRTSTALPPTAVHRPPILRHNSYYNEKKKTQISLSWVHCQTLNKVPKILFVFFFFFILPFFTKAYSL